MRFVKFNLLVVFLTQYHLSLASCHVFPNSKRNHFLQEQESDVELTRHAKSSRYMIAASPAIDLKARSIGLTSFLKHDHFLHFIEGSLASKTCSFC